MADIIQFYLTFNKRVLITVMLFRPNFTSCPCVFRAEFYIPYRSVMYTFVKKSVYHTGLKI